MPTNHPSGCRCPVCYESWLETTVTPAPKKPTPPDIVVMREGSKRPKDVRESFKSPEQFAMLAEKFAAKDAALRQCVEALNAAGSLFSLGTTCSVTRSPDVRQHCIEGQYAATKAIDAAIIAAKEAIGDE